MSDEQHGELGITADRNEIELDGTVQSSTLEYSNDTLPDANSTKAIDPFYFYEYTISTQQLVARYYPLFIRYYKFLQIENNTDYTGLTARRLLHKKPGKGVGTNAIFLLAPFLTTTDLYYIIQTEQFTVLWLLFAMIVVGNIAVLIGLLWGKRRKTRMDFFIKQLALADLLVGLISVVTDIIWRTTVTWHAGNFACKLIKFMQALVTYSSTYVLVALSIDRYDAITRPMNFTGRWWRARALVVAAWSLSALFSAPIFFLYEEKLIEGKTQCWIELDTQTHWRIYMSLVSVSLFIAPTLIIGGCYAVIVATIWSQGGVLRQGPTRDTRRASSRGLIPRAKVKTVKMTLVIVFVFILCWSPYIVFDLLQVYGYVPRTQTNIAVASFIQSLTPLNSAANPIIYCLFSTSFCKTVRNMQAISWVFGWCASNPHHCFGTGGGPNSSTRTTVTTSLTAHSSRRSGHIAVLHSTSRKRVMVSLV